MNYELLKIIPYSELKEIALSMDLKIHRSKKGLIDDITECFKEYETYRKEYIYKYEKIEQLGERGKEGTTYLVRTHEGDEYAMKTFRKQKSSATLRNEANLQKRAAKVGVAPMVICRDTVSKYIVMEKMDRHLVDVMRKQNGDLKKTQQLAIIKLYKKLDECLVFHSDSNLTNYMYLKKRLYLIDYGMAKEITPTLCKKLGTNTPNMSLMTVGLVLKLKELKCPSSSYQYILPFIPVETQIKLGLK
jgi:tRNA A-37 threonylcarbamoyl transferase component Bud32